MQPENYNSIYSSKDRNLFLSYLKKNIDPNSNILEIGPGTGLSTDLIKDFARELTLVEPNKEYYAYLNKKFCDSKFKIFNGYLSESPEVKYDAIIMVFNVINHISFDQINDFIQNISKRSKKRTKIYFDMYNSNCVKKIPPQEVVKVLADERTLYISPKLKNNILNLTYKIEKEIIEEMNLYLHNSKEIISNFSNNGFRLQRKELLGRSGDCYFYEVLGFYE